MITVRNSWSPAREMLALRSVMDQLFDDRVARLGEGESWRPDGSFNPAADAWEDEDSLVIELALPGATPEQVDVRFEKDRLTVSGDIAPRDADKRWVLAERGRGHFQRQFTLRTPVVADRAAAHFANGVLTLTLPKSEAVKPRKIEVQTA